MKDEVVIGSTQSVCPECAAVIKAVKVARKQDVVLWKTCAAHGLFETVIWRGEPCYESWNRPKIACHPGNPFTPVEQGCPWDCGLCPDHRQQTCTALLEVTQRCNLGCAFCFADAGKKGVPGDPDLNTITGWFRRLLDAGGPYNIQLSGGEPTVRDDLPEIIQLGRSLGFDFIQVNTNGLRLGEDPRYVQELKSAGLSSVFLQFDGLDDGVHQKLRGRSLAAIKRKAMDNCAGSNLAVVLVPTLVPGINIDQIGKIIELASQHVPVTRGVHFQPVSYFGRYPAAPSNEERITIPEILREIEKQTGGRMKVGNFKPPGCENAYCSFHANFVVMPDGNYHSWTRHDPARCGCKAERAEQGAAKARSFVAQFWSPPPGALMQQLKGPSLGDWEAFIERSRTHSLCISGMAFQDAWNLDLDRLRDCCIHVVHQDGRIIPFCAFNLTSREGHSFYRNGPFSL